MDGLTVEEITRLYDAPPLRLAMTGGPHCGETVLIPGDREPPTGYVFPVTPEPAFTTMFDGNAARPPFSPIRTDLYCFTGRIQDDGARVFSYSGRS